jgi:hypothetical protein
MAFTEQGVAILSSVLRRKNPDNPACPVKCLPNGIQSLFHRGGAYLTGVNFYPVE